ncbi:MAG: toxin [Chloroflexi bacterium]|nr:toxin [Chloroflexota bacterium]
MAIRFARTVVRHGVSQVRARYVVEHCTCPLYSGEPGDEDLVIFLGPDETGVPLEVMAIDLADGNLLVIHAMKMRRKYVDNYRRVIECQGQ